MLKNPISPTTPHAIGHHFVSAADKDEYTQIQKGVIHALVVPFVLFFIHPLLSSSYLLFATLLYTTVFRHKSSGFFAVLLATLLLTLLLVVS